MPTTPVVRAAVLLALLLGCGGGGGGTGPVPPPPPGPPPPPPAPPVLLQSPIVGVPGENLWYGAYVDHGGVDYNCGIKYYGGHRGVDILLRNFQVQDSGVTVVAAAAGRVIFIRDGLPDRSTVNGSGGFGNHVILEHGSSPTTTYGHLRAGSILVQQDQEVTAGQPLGLVGSSGNSNWPHLHFEVGSSQDPFSGPCNTVATRWQNQLPYQDAFAVLDAGLTDRQSVSFADLLERIPDLESFATASAPSLLFWIELSNIRAGATRFVLRRPDDSEALFVDRGATSTFSSLFLTWRFGIGSLDTPGVWRVEFWHTPTGTSSSVLAGSVSLEVTANGRSDSQFWGDLPAEGRIEVHRSGGGS